MVDPAALRDVFDRAISLPPSDRAAFVERACGADAALRREVERLLAADAEGGSVLDDPWSGLGGQATGQSGRQAAALLPNGTRLGPYEIEAPAGAGGMGQVYRARDARLHRTVAIKVLPPDLSDDALARQRFEREARAVAALSHPHICPLFDVGRQGAVDYLVMEYLRGETLAVRLQRGRVGLREALTMALQIASALAAAHRAGIVHRDLKPGNIMLTEAGVRLLDFGLARHTEATVGDATVTVPEPLTGTGMVLGTLPYSAPEQLEGRATDARTDIFAFGVVLYEMVTGRRAFAGTSQAALVGSILRDDPPFLSAVDPTLPPALDRMIRRCISKDPAQRWPTMAEAQGRLEALQDVTSDSYTTPSVDDASPTSRESPRRHSSTVSVWRRRGFVPVASAAFLVIASGTWWIYRDASGHRPKGSNASAQHSLKRITFDDSGGSYATFSPDGRFIAYDSGGDLRVRPTAGGNPVQITTAVAVESMPDWSPDATSIAFERLGDGVFVIAALGGQERRIASFGEFPMWSPDGTQILFTTGAFSSAIKLFLAATDQPPRQILATFLDGGHWQLPTWHPDGRITIAGRHRTNGLGLYTISWQDNRWVKTTFPSELLVDTNIDPEQVQVLSWAPTTEFLYATCPTKTGVGNIWRLRMDSALRITAIDRLTTGPGADWWPKISRDGKNLLFTVFTGNSRLWSFPFGGPTSRAVGTGQPLSEEDGEVNWASVSPDGRRLAYYYRPLNAAIGASELRLLAAPFSAPPERVPTDHWVRMASAWSHTGDRLALQAAELSSAGAVVANLLVIRERSGSEHAIARCQNAPEAAPCSLVPVDWTPDDTSILVTSRVADERQTQLGVWPVSVETPSQSPSKVLLSDPDWNISQGTYSPDGRWLAFSYGGEYHDEKGIAVVPAGGNVARSSWRSIASGFEGVGNPRWSADGRQLFFTSLRGSGFMRVWHVGVMASTGVPVGSPMVFSASDGSDLMVVSLSYYPTIAVGADRLILPMFSQKTAAWMLDNVDR